jgi:hypothetical protein
MTSLLVRSDAKGRVSSRRQRCSFSYTAYLDGSAVLNVFNNHFIRAWRRPTPPNVSYGRLDDKTARFTAETGHGPDENTIGHRHDKERKALTKINRKTTSADGEFSLCARGRTDLDTSGHGQIRNGVEF